MSFEYVAETIRALRADLEDTRRRLASMVMTGRVIEIKGDMVRLEFDETDPSTGEPFRSPLIRRANSAGREGQGHKERNRPVVGEVMALISPNGEIGRHSRAIPYGPTDDSGEPAGDEGFARVFAEGNASIALRDGEIRFKVGGSSVSLTGEGFEQTGGYQRHDGRNVGKDHVHGDVTPGGSDTGVPSN
jgi:hypothetical protein